MRIFIEIHRAFIGKSFVIRPPTENQDASLKAESNNPF